jgi:hypothetical protein
VPLGFAVIIIVSLLTPAPKRKIQELVEHVRYPNLESIAINANHFAYRNKGAGQKKPAPRAGC